MSDTLSVQGKGWLNGGPTLLGDGPWKARLGGRGRTSPFSFPAGPAWKQAPPPPPSALPSLEAWLLVAWKGLTKRVTARLQKPPSAFGRGMGKLVGRASVSHMLSCTSWLRADLVTGGHVTGHRALGERSSTTAGRRGRHRRPEPSAPMCACSARPPEPARRRPLRAPSLPLF